MVSRRRRLGKRAAVRFADPPWNEEHPDWLRLDEQLPADHPARQIVAAMQTLDLTPLFASYSAGGTPPIRPDLMLRMVLIEIQRGRFRASQWCRDAREYLPLAWAGRGLHPSRTCWYEFARRIASFVDRWNQQVIEAARQAALTPATRAALDGSTVAANASRHRLLNQQRLGKRLGQLQAACSADNAGEPAEDRPGGMAKTPSGRTEQLDRLKRAEQRLAELQALQQRQQASRRRPREKIVVSPADPEAALGLDKLKVFRPLYNIQLVRDLDSPLILGYELFAQANDEGLLKPMLRRLRRTFDVPLDVLLTDPAYVTACNLAVCRRAGVTLYGPWTEHRSTSGRTASTPQIPKSRFQWRPQENQYVCPQGQRLIWIGQERRPQADGEINTVHRYRCPAIYCRVCGLRDECTAGTNRGRSLRRSEHEDLIEDHKRRMQSDEARTVYKLRGQTVELGFADLKEHRNLQRFSGRGRLRARAQLALTVLATNLIVFSRLQSAERPLPDPG